MSTNTPGTPETVEADPKRPYKAIAGAVVTFLGLLWAALEGRDNLDNMTAMEWASVIVPVILTFATIYGVRNPKMTPTVPGLNRGERGAGEVRLFLIVLGAVVVAFLLYWLLIRAA